MNNAQLQEAINKAREFILNTSASSGPIWDARQQTTRSLRELEAIQVMRAGMATKPILTKQA